MDVERVIGNRALVIHHWDADGVSSAAILLAEFGDRISSLYTPPIGSYSLPPGDVAGATTGADSAVVVDLALPRSDLEGLAGAVGRVAVVDHHVREDHLDGVPGISARVDPSAPSASWLLTSILGRQADGLSALGVAGDLGSRLKGHPAAPEVEKAARRSGLDLRELVRLARLVDSNYRVGDRDGVVEAARILASSRGNLKPLLEREEWIARLRRAEDELARVREEMLYRREGAIIYAEFESPHNLISAVGRELAWRAEGVVAVVMNRSWRDGMAQLYVRANGVDVGLDRLRREALSRGYSAGGKSDVLGVILPEDEAREFLRAVMEILREEVGR